MVCHRTLPFGSRFRPDRRLAGIGERTAPGQALRCRTGGLAWEPIPSETGRASAQRLRRKETNVSDWLTLKVDQELWERVFVVSPLVLVGTREPDGSFDFAPKHRIVTLPGH